MKSRGAMKSPLPPPPTTTKPVYIVKFDPKQYGIRPKGDAKPPVQPPIVESVSKSDFDKTEDKYDKEVNDIFSVLTSVQDFTSSFLEGKDRHQFMKNKLVKLGVKAKPDPKIPFKIKTGMKQKAKERAKKQKDQQRELGLLTKKSKKK